MPFATQLDDCHGLYSLQYTNPRNLNLVVVLCWFSLVIARFIFRISGYPLFAVLYKYYLSSLDRCGYPVLTVVVILSRSLLLRVSTRGDRPAEKAGDAANK